MNTIVRTDLSHALPASAKRLRTRSLLSGIAVVLTLILLIALGSREFHWFDTALIGYAVVIAFATAAATYKYMFWLAGPHGTLLAQQIDVLRQASHQVKKDGQETSFDANGALPNGWKAPQAPRFSY